MEGETSPMSGGDTLLFFLEPRFVSWVVLSLGLGWLLLRLFSIDNPKNKKEYNNKNKELMSPASSLPEAQEQTNKTFTAKELAQFDGSHPGRPIYMAIKGRVFDVSKSAQMYAKPAGYSVFTGKDASRALAKSSLQSEDCVGDLAGLTPEELETLDKWEAHYLKKYPLVGSLGSL